MNLQELSVAVERGRRWRKKEEERRGDEGSKEEEENKGCMLCI